MVDSLKSELLELQPFLEQKAIEAEKLLEQVSKDQAAAAIVKERVAKDEEEVHVMHVNRCKAEFCKLVHEHKNKHVKYFNVYWRINTK